MTSTLAFYAGVIVGTVLTLLTIIIMESRP